MLNTGYYYLLNGLAVVCFAYATASCTVEPACDGAIKSVALYLRCDPNFGGDKIYVDLKNKGGVGVRKTLHLATGEVAEFYKVAIIDDFRHKFAGRKHICFDKYSAMVATCGAE